MKSKCLNVSWAFDVQLGSVSCGIFKVLNREADQIPCLSFVTYAVCIA
jgi:hypothetical protein